MTPAAAPVVRTAGVPLRKLQFRAGRFLLAAKPAAVNLVSTPLFAGGLACIDNAAFHLAHGWGWLATGVSLIVLERVIADEAE